ncbi:MAG: preprotein translocase subunit SecY [Candidatus Thorarchaeota archaeon]|nr:MAG: preprotein translocase subunit SecY [Candidatus Thorarchaeota archaeon]
MPSMFLRALSPLVRVMPEVKAPDREISFREKIIWTLIILVLFLVMSHMPLYGVDPATGTDYLWAMRVILASTRGTLMELGIGPIVTAGLVMQLLSGSKIIDVDFSDPEDRSLFTGGQKVLAMIMTAFQAFAYIVGNAYGPLPPAMQVIIWFQLFVSGMIVILMDELIQKGWGLGSGVSLFIMTNVAGQVMFNMLNITEVETVAPVGYALASTNLPKGIIAAMIANLLRAFGVGEEPPVDVAWLFIRNGFDPSVLALIVTFLIFFGVLWMESVRVEIPLQYAKYRGMRARYPIKLLYTSNIPVILAQALYANILFFGQIIFNAWNPGANNPFLNWLGVFEQDPDSARMIAVSGLARYITPPQGIFSLIREDDFLIHVIIYSALMILLCWGFSKIWVEISGIAPRDVSRQLLNSGYIVPGFRRSEKVLERLLERYIPVVAGLGGFLVGVLAAAADVMGALASGTGILLMVSIIKQYYEQIAKEQLAQMGGEGVQGLLGII